MVNLNEFVQFYDNSLDNLTCDYLVNFFEENNAFHQTTDDGKIIQLNLTEFREVSEDVQKVHNDLIRSVFKYRDEYYELFDRAVFPENHAFEPFKIQKYMPNDEDHYEVHLDVKDYDSARRYLCFMWFLNENKAGQSEFLELFVQPSKGKLVVYPPFWMFPYKKYTPIQEPQYILKTYLHYK